MDRSSDPVPARARPRWRPHLRASRPRGSRAATRLTVVIALALAGLGGCTYRGAVPVALEPVALPEGAPPIDGAVELCVTRALRLAHWRYRDRFYSVQLGRKVSLAVERLTKQAVRDVLVSFDEPCGSASDRPWLEARLAGAERDRDFDLGVDRTQLEVELSLYADDGRVLWRHTDMGEIEQAPRFFAFAHTRASEDFGRAARAALEQAFVALRSSDAVSQALAPAR